MTRLRLAVTALLCLTTTVAFADATIEFETREAGKTEPTRGRMHLRAGSLRFDTEAASKDKAPTAVIFDASTETLYIVSAAEKSYFEINQATITAMTGMMTGMMKQMQDRMAGMPPEQRKMMEEMMAKNAPAAPPTVVHRLIKNGESREIGGHSAVRWDATKDGEKVAELWLGSYGSTHIDPTSFAVLDKMAEFFRKMTRDLQSNPMFKNNIQGADILSSMAGLEGVPLLVRRVEAGKVTQETTMVSVSGDPIDAKLFELTGLEKRDLMQQGATRRRGQE